MSLRLLTAGGGAAWESALALACQESDVAAQVVQRCYDLGDLLAVASGGRADAALVAATMRWLDREAVARLHAEQVTVVGVVAVGDEEAERRLRQVGIDQVALADASPAGLVELAARARDALLAGSEPGPVPTTGPTPTTGAVPTTGAARTAGPAPRATADLRAGAGRHAGADPVAEEADGGRRVVVVWGPMGAPGATTVAMNLAFEAAALGIDTLLVDANTYSARIAQRLAFMEDYPGLAWAARLASRGELDAPRLWREVRPAAAGPAPRVLVGLSRPQLWTELRPATWEALLELFRTAFPLTVVDVAFCLEEDEELSYDQVRHRRNAVTRLALQQADLVVAVTKLDPDGLRELIQAYHDLRELGVGLDRLRVVVNQVRGGLFAGDPVESVRSVLVRYLGVEPVAWIPYDRAAFDAAGRAGQALREATPRSGAQKALGRLAVDLLGTGQPAALAAPARRRRRLIPRQA